jgi:two-component system CheB/CheR fusion protein
VIPRRGPSSRLSGYAVALIATAIVALVRIALRVPIGEKLQFTPFTLSVVAAATWGGLRPGLLATVAGALVEMWAVVPTEFSVSKAGLPDWTDAALFVVIGAAISWLCESLHASRRRSDRARRRLERSVESRVAAERALASSEAAARERLVELQAVYAATPIAMLELDADLRCVRASDRASEIYGCAGLVHEGRPLRELLPAVADALEPAARRVHDTGEPVLDLTIASPAGGDLDSARHWVQSLYPVRDPDGRVAGVSIVAQEITARMRAERELSRATEQLRIITDSMEAPVTRCTRDLRYQWVSRSYAEWLQLPSDRIVGRPIEEVIGPAAMEALRPHFQSVLAGEVVRYEEDVEFRGIGSRWIRAVYTPTRDASGAVDGWVAVVTDLQALKEAERALREADARKERFLATLAHELRNPLAPLRNSLEILKRQGVPTSVAREARAAMERQLGHAVRLVDDLLDVSRINRDVLELRLERCDVGAVLAQAVETVRPYLEGGRHTLALDLPPRPLWLRADPVRLAQVFANLLHNACKFSDPGAAIALTASTDSGWITVRVADPGIGFPPEMSERIFEMFVQLESEPSRGRGGLGVGLSLVRRLTEMHGGRVEASSGGEGRGSEFRVVLPELPAASDGAAPFLRVSPLSAASSRRILVVDDNADSARSLSTLLALSGNETRVAHDGVEAVSEAETFQPDVVLLDIGMPRMDGYEAARRIRQLPNGRDMLLVAVSGWGQQEDRRRSREAGFDHHMVKPLRASALETLLAATPPHAADAGEALR